MNLRILEAAQADIDSTARRLELEVRGYGLEFLDLYREARSRIVTSPWQHSLTEDGPAEPETREVYIERFKQRVIYTVTETELVILAIIHAQRRPGSWLPRTEQI